MDRDKLDRDKFDIQNDDSLESQSAYWTSYKGVADYLSSLLLAERQDIWVIAIYSLLISIMSLVVPIGVQTIVNTVAFGTLIQPLIILTILVFIVLGFSGVIKIAQLCVVELLQQRLFSRVAINLAYRIPRIKAIIFREEFPPELINRFFEVALVQKSISFLALEGIAIILQAVIGLFVLSLYHPILLLYVLILIISIAFVLFLFGYGAIDTSIDESSAKHSVLIWLENIAQNPILFRTKAGYDYAFRRADDITSYYVKTRRRHFRILLRQHLGFTLIQVISSAGLLGVGGYLVIKQSLTLGQLVAAELIVSGLLAKISKTGKLLESFYDLIASISKLDSLIELDLEEWKGDELTPTERGLSISIRNLTLKFPPNKVVFNKLNLEVPDGECIAICGGNASGKSLLASMIFKLDSASSGVIELNGQNINDINPSSLREKVVLVRNVEVFRGTIEDNLRLGREDLTNFELRNALASVHLQEEIDSLPDGLKTFIHEDARPLSSGQARRLMLARAMLGKPSLIIIDELLDSIDKEVLVNHVIPSLKSHRSEWTLLIMTHEMDIASYFDKVCILENGILTYSNLGNF